MSEKSTPRRHPEIPPNGSLSLSRERKVESSLASQNRHASTSRPSRESGKEERRGSAPLDHRETIPNGSLSLPHKRKAELLPAPQDRHAFASRLPREPGRNERRGDTARIEAEELGQLRREVEYLKGVVDRQGTEVVGLRGEREKLTEECKRKDDRIVKLEHDIAKMRGSYQKAEEAQTRQAREMQERLKQTEKLLETRSAELSGAHTFLSTADRLSETEVLSIVRDLNESIYQVAVSLAEEWEKLNPSQATSRMDVGPAFRTPVAALVQLTRDRDLMGLTFLLQTSICSLAVEMTSSWGYRPELAMLKSLYRRLSASEGQAISARWRSLTHSYVSQPPPHSTLLVEQLANVLDETGSFASIQQSLEFVRAIALGRIESMIQISQRLEAAFMVDVTSSDMTLLFEAPDAVFDEARMTNEFGSDSAAMPGGWDRIAGTTEVGVAKSIFGGPGEKRRAEVLLKTKVVLEKDAVGDGK